MENPSPIRATKPEQAVEMNSSGSITLGDLQGRVAMLEIACRRCERKGRLRLDRLIEEHGVDYLLPDLRDILAGDCPQAGSARLSERCGIHYPQLPALFPAARKDDGGG